MIGLAPVMVLVLIGVVGYGIVRRFSRRPDEVEGGAFQEKLLYELDRLQVQMQIANERLERLETHYLGPPRGEALPKGEQNDDRR
jgi:hypothetical protein